MIQQLLSKSKIKLIFNSIKWIEKFYFMLVRPEELAGIIKAFENSKISNLWNR